MKGSQIILWLALGGLAVGEPAWRVVNPNAPYTQFIKIRHKLACDRDNNCYVVSQTARPDAYSDIHIAKYNPAGRQLWERWVAGGRDGEDAVNSLAVDSQNHLWVAGYLSSDDQGRNALLQRYSPDGSLDFSSIRNGSMNQDDRWDRLLLGPNDTAYLVGTLDDVNGNANSDSTYIVAAVRPTGEQLWQQASRRTSRNRPNAPVLAIQNVPPRPPAEPVSKLPRQNPKYVPNNQTGPVVNPLPQLLLKEIGKQLGLTPRNSNSSLLVTFPEYATTTRGGMLFERYDLNSGAPLPAALGESGPRPKWTHWVDQVDVEADGSLTVLGTGGTDTGPSPYRSWVWRLDPQLNSQWLTVCPPANGDDGPLNLMRKAPDGSIYLAGWNRFSGLARARALVVRLNVAGEQLWQRSLGRDQTGTLLVTTGMALRPDGNLVLASDTFDNDSPPQVQGLVSQITPDGTVTILDTWTMADYRYQGAQYMPSSTRCWGLAQALDGSVYVAGEFRGPGFSAHILTRYLFP